MIEDGSSLANRALARFLLALGAIAAAVATAAWLLSIARAQLEQLARAL